MPTAEQNDSPSSLPAVLFVVAGASAVLLALAVTTNSTESASRLALAPKSPAATQVSAARGNEGDAGKQGVVDHRTAQLKRRLSRTTVLDERTLRRVLNDFGSAANASPTASLWLARTLRSFTAVTESDKTVRRAAVAVLGRFDRQYVLDDPFTEFFTDPDPVIRAEAVGGRARHGLSGHVSAATTLVTDGDASVRLAVARALGTVSDAHGATGLLALISDTDRGVARAAAKAFARTWRGPLPTRLIEAAGDESPTTRLAVALVLRDLRSQQSTNLLAELCTDSDWQVREAAVAALGRVRRQTAGVAVAKLLGIAYDESAPRHDRFEALQALSKLGDAASDPKLAEIAVGSADPLLRLAACRTALAHGDLRVLDALTELLEVRKGPHCDDEDMQFIHRVAWETLGDATGLQLTARDAAAWERGLLRLRTRSLDELPTYRPRHLNAFR